MIPIISDSPLMIITIYFDGMFRIGLQMADVDLDARVTALEENSGGNSQNGK